MRFFDDTKVVIFLKIRKFQIFLVVFLLQLKKIINLNFADCIFGYIFLYFCIKNFFNMVKNRKTLDFSLLKIKL
jgi:hypothetical protein